MERSAKKPRIHTPEETKELGINDPPYVRHPIENSIVTEQFLLDQVTATQKTCILLTVREGGNYQYYYYHSDQNKLFIVSRSMVNDQFEDVYTSINHPLKTATFNDPTNIVLNPEIFGLYHPPKILYRNLGLIATDQLSLDYVASNPGTCILLTTLQGSGSYQYYYFHGDQNKLFIVYRSINDQSKDVYRVLDDPLKFEDLETLAWFQEAKSNETVQKI